MSSFLSMIIVKITSQLVQSNSERTMHITFDTIEQHNVKDIVGKMVDKDSDCLFDIARFIKDVLK